ncbi:MAG: hypothetical protein WCA04_01490 [Geobacteraceae bacterium]
MSLKTCVRKIDLGNSLTVSMYDTTRRYYEDYHLVRLEIECDIAVQESYFESTEEFAKARALLGDSVRYLRTVEKMGVPFTGIDTAREELISCFIATALPYFSREDFPQKMVQSELHKASDKMLRSVV